MVEGGDGGGNPGGYRHGVFVRAARGSSIDVGLFHDDQRRSVATVEFWVNAGENVSAGRAYPPLSDLIFLGCCVLF